jgi:hypothetical protein
MALVPRRALKIVGIVDGSYDLRMKLPGAEAVVTVAHVQPRAQAEVYAQAFGCAPLALHPIENALEIEPDAIRRRPGLGLFYALSTIATVRPALLASQDAGNTGARAPLPPVGGAIPKVSRAPRFCHAGLFPFMV